MHAQIKGDQRDWFPETEHVKFRQQPSFYPAFYWTFVIIILHFLFSLLFLVLVVFEK